MIEIEEGGLRALEQHVLSGLERLMDEVHRIGDHRSETRCATLEIFCGDHIGIELRGELAALIVSLDRDGPVKLIPVDLAWNRFERRPCHFAQRSFL